MTAPPKKLLDRMRDILRVKHYSIRTEQTYVNWAKRYILFHDKRHPKDMGSQEIAAFLTHLAVDRNVAASTQNQALCALLFLYNEVLHIDVGPVDAIRAKKPKRLPTVLTRDEVERVIAAVTGPNRLVVKLLYGSGLRLIECLRLRVKDVDFAYRQITVRDGKGHKDRVTVLPGKLVDPLKIHLRHVALIHQRDLDHGYGAVYLPYALEVKYPNANKEWCWQYVFPARSLSRDPRSGITRRHHLGESAIQRAVRSAVRLAGIEKSVGCHPSARRRLRHQNCPGTLGSQGRQDDHGLHSRLEPRRPRRPQPPRRLAQLTNQPTDQPPNFQSPTPCGIMLLDGRVRPPPRA